MMPICKAAVVTYALVFHGVTQLGYECFVERWVCEVASQAANAAFLSDEFLGHTAECVPQPAITNDKSMGGPTSWWMSRP